MNCPSLLVVPRIIDTEAGMMTEGGDIQTDCVIVGLVYKDMPLRSSVSCHDNLILNYNIAGTILDELSLLCGKVIAG